MSLTKQDIQLIKEALQPQFSGLQNQMDSVQNRIDGVHNQINSVQTELKKEIKENTNILKVYMDTRLQAIKTTIDETKNDILRETDAVLRDHENRIKSLERGHHTPS